MQRHLRLHPITSVEAVPKLVYRRGIVTPAEMLSTSPLWGEIGGGAELSPRWR